MDNNNFDLENIKACINFAIDKEQEAVDFYMDLASKVTSQPIVDELVKIADMEKGHKNKLMNINLATLIAADKKEVEDLKIANYTVDKAPSADMTMQDLVNLAMHKELAAQKLYADLANSVQDANVSALFNQLSNEEAEHKNYFERLWDDNIMKEN
ncbi:MAG: ferritin family protein [Pseudomonadota bacterium]